MTNETVLLVGATGNIGVAMAIAALRSKRQLLALVRNQASAEKLYKYLGTREGVITVEVDIMSEDGIQSVVDRVKAGELPSFQHVFSSGQLWKLLRRLDLLQIAFYSSPELKLTDRVCPKLTGGGEYCPKDLATMSLDYFLAYRATIPYLIEQGNPNSTWTTCTGAQGDWGVYQMPSITQGAVFSMSAVAAYEQKETNVRFNEIYLSFRVELDDDADAHGVTRSSDFGEIYERLLERPDIRGMRVLALEPADIKDLKFEPKGLPLQQKKA
ncbi:hypothetical protein HJFPF1_13198 [Paramyrothecium foliicola]|nr:hypothetical protein HJFPF1_13198 [Paramyrothecium foliicola]